MKNKSIKINAILNVIKQCLGILFPLITYPYVSRVLGAENLGRYSFSDSIVQTLITISLLGIPTYAVREGAMIRNDKKKIEDFCSEVFTINFLSALLSYLLLIILILTVARIRLEQVFIMILSINIMSCCLGRDWLNTVYEEYLYITIRYIAIHIISLVLILLLVKKEDDLLTYVIIMAFSSFAGYMINIFYTARMVPYRFTVSKELLKHMKPLLILFCSSIASTVYINSDITILGFMRSNSEVGVYTMTSKIYSIVKNVLNAIIMVTVPRLSFYLGNPSDDSLQKYNELLNQIRNALLLLVFPAVTGLFCLSSDVLRLLGGNGFQSGVTSLRILCFAMIFAVFGCFYAHAVLIVNRLDHVFFNATVISAIVNIVLNLIFIPFWGINGAALTTALSEICIVLICALPAKRFFQNDRSQLIHYLIPTGMECLSIFVISYITSVMIDSIIIRVILTIIFSIIVYLFILYFSKMDFVIDTISNVIGKKYKDS